MLTLPACCLLRACPPSPVTCAPVWLYVMVLTQPACCPLPPRSGIFYHDEEQRAIAEARIKQVQEQIMAGQIGKNWGSNKVVATLAPAGDYYLAEVGAGLTGAVLGSALCCSVQGVELLAAWTACILCKHV